MYAKTDQLNLFLNACFNILYFVVRWYSGGLNRRITLIIEINYTYFFTWKNNNNTMNVYCTPLLMKYIHFRGSGCYSSIQYELHRTRGDICPAVNEHKQYLPINTNDHILQQYRFSVEFCWSKDIILIYLHIYKIWAIDVSEH